MRMNGIHKANFVNSITTQMLIQSILQNTCGKYLALMGLTFPGTKCLANLTTSGVPTVV